MATPTHLKPDHYLRLNFECDEDVAFIIQQANGGPLRHAPRLDDKIRSEIDHGSVFILHEVTGFKNPEAWDDGKKWKRVQDQPFRVEREVGSDGALGSLYRKWGCHKGHWVVVYYKDEAKLIVLTPNGV